jgi:oligoendopeptidase F
MRDGIIGVVLFVLVGGAPASGQVDSPVRHVALDRWFFASPAAARAAISRLDSVLLRLDGARSQTTRSAAGLERTLALHDTIAAAALRLTSYFHVRAATDTRDLASAHAEDSIRAAVESRTAWLNGALRRVTSDSMARWRTRRPSIARYAFVVDRARLSTAHTLPDAEEAAFQRMLPLATGWAFPMWQRLAPAAREPRAFVIVETARTRNALAREHAFASAPDEAYAWRYLTTPDVRALIARVRGRAALYRRFLELKQRRAALADSPVAIPLDSVESILTAALRPFGDVYGGEIRKLFDPSRGALDIASAPNRQRGGFPFHSPGRGSGVYLDGYAGRLRDFSRLTHESAHAIHGTLNDRRGVLMAYRFGPLLEEPIALVNELVAADYLYKKASGVPAQRQILEHFLNKAFEVFLGAQDAEVEQAIYDGVVAGRITSADDLDTLTRTVDAAYTLAPAPEAARRWMNMQLLVEDPLYLSNYLYAGMISLAIYEEYAKAPETFGPRYVEFVERGLDAPPIDLLGRHLGIDLTRPDVLDRGFALLEQRLAEFEQLLGRNSD